MPNKSFKLENDRLPRPVAVESIQPYMAPHGPIQHYGSGGYPKINQAHQRENLRVKMSYFVFNMTKTD